MSNINDIDNLKIKIQQLESQLVEKDREIEKWKRCNTLNVNTAEEYDKELQQTKAQLAEAIKVIDLLSKYGHPESREFLNKIKNETK